MSPAEVPLRRIGWTGPGSSDRRDRAEQERGSHEQEVRGKTAIITDASRGIGLAITEQYPLKRLGEPGNIASVVAFLLSRDAGWMTGQVLVMDGGATITGGGE